MFYAYASMFNNILEIFMKKILSIVLFGLVSSMAYSADKLTLQLQWVTQAQFAGYYVALDKGYYNDENLNVTIKPGRPGYITPQVLLEVVPMSSEWMPSALAAREKGVPVVNIAQTFKRAGLMLTCWKDIQYPLLRF